MQLEEKSLLEEAKLYRKNNKMVQISHFLIFSGTLGQGYLAGMVWQKHNPLLTFSPLNSLQQSNFCGLE